MPPAPGPASWRDSWASRCRCSPPGRRCSRSRPEHAYVGPVAACRRRHAAAAAGPRRRGGGRLLPAREGGSRHRQGDGSDGSRGARARAPRRGRAGPGPHAQGPRLVGRGRISARHAAGDRLERHDAGPAARVRLLGARLSNSRPASARSWPTCSSTAGPTTPIDAFSIRRFAGGVVPDEKLWSEFDPELVATFRQMRARCRPCLSASAPTTASPSAS